ncbi:hypothetical protein IVB41_27320 [Bradyrhizobium sp. 44]|uniref:hypothetical protein n=1 Tax=Bradyrhizobium sp. 44 TaxID=2782675 RepID=UPI001FF9CD7E|nr:hypothetical protein [Bradyrhizobium sp. 44]MCK1287619.1 hypothetical protein [Bradyrhizobium sp. 44]
MPAKAQFYHPKAATAKLFARSASCDLTPRDHPVPLAGYALRKAPVSEVLDPIEMSAVLLECSEGRCLLFSFDLMIVGSELQNMILMKLERMGFRADEVMLLASHTHNAPATDRACERLGTPDFAFVNSVAEAAETLLRQIQQEEPSEVSLSVSQGQLNHSINRRRYWPFPTIGRMHGFQLTSVAFSPNPSGPKDEWATVILLRRADDQRVLSAIWHYTCHPTAVMPDNVISADYPGAVRQALRERFGDIPCLFIQGFCGNIRPNIQASRQKIGLRERFRKLIRVVAFGNLFPTLSVGDWMRWSRGLAACVGDIAKGNPVKTFSPTRLQTGSARIPLGDFFKGSFPDKMLVAQVIRIGQELEIVALSAEPSVEWERILDEAVPPRSGLIRLYSGYLGALFGYLPTTTQVPEGGYEVEGFQPFFGLSGRFEPGQIGPAVAGCIRNAFEDLEHPKQRLVEPPSPAH